MTILSKLSFMGGRVARLFPGQPGQNGSGSLDKSLSAQDSDATNENDYDARCAVMVQMFTEEVGVQISVILYRITKNTAGEAENHYCLRARARCTMIPRYRRAQFRPVNLRRPGL